MTAGRFESWSLRNWERIRLVWGLLFIALATHALVIDVYFSAVVAGVVGCWLLGRWPAVQLFVHRPTMMIRHWYYILIDARQLHHWHKKDGSVEVVRMRPTLRRGWEWTEERRWNRGDRVSLDEEVTNS